MGAIHHPKCHCYLAGSQGKKLMKKIATTALILIAIVAIAFRATHHPVYGKCHQVADQRICTLIKWEGNK
jgi:hypothetical protein